ncbi:hypothetical protein C7212DRAFT_366233 [Tuber magnatum]|uniref:Uncharacterized protein n=1 Tax=Tuber magnatum TaxID=42249 RepID=A0A317SEZ0_9PEZI|nr:hypothetical protein C7212DRAFT_366233 [Tuber magnatum]
MAKEVGEKKWNRLWITVCSCGAEQKPVATCWLNPRDQHILRSPLAIHDTAIPSTTYSSRDLPLFYSSTRQTVIMTSLILGSRALRSLDHHTSKFCRTFRCIPRTEWSGSQVVGERDQPVLFDAILVARSPIGKVGSLVQDARKTLTDAAKVDKLYVKKRQRRMFVANSGGLDLANLNHRLDTELRALKETMATQKAELELALKDRIAAHKAEAALESKERMAAHKAETAQEVKKMAAHKAETAQELKKMAAHKAETAQVLKKMAAQKAETTQELKKEIASYKAETTDELRKMAVDNAETAEVLHAKMAAYKAETVQELHMKMAANKDETVQELKKLAARKAESTADLHAKMAVHKAETAEELQKLAAHEAETTKELHAKMAVHKAELDLIDSQQEERLRYLLRSDDCYKLVRNRYLSTFKRDYLQTCTKADLEIIANGDLTAHWGDAIIDSSLYTQPNGRTDVEVFQKLYGILPHNMEGIREDKTIYILNTHAGILSSISKKGSDKFSDAFAKFIKLFEISGFDESYLYGKDTEVTRAYGAFVDCVLSEVKHVRPRRRS